MSLRFQITNEDLLRSKVVSPGWYTLKIARVEAQQASTDGSDMAVVTFIITSDGPAKGVPITRYFSLKESARGFLIDFIAALQGKAVNGPIEGDFEAAVGREVQGYVKNDEYNNRMTNKVEGFRPAQ